MKRKTQTKARQSAAAKKARRAKKTLSQEQRNHQHTQSTGGRKKTTPVSSLPKGMTLATPQIERASQAVGCQCATKHDPDELKKLIQQEVEMGLKVAREEINQTLMAQGVTISNLRKEAEEKVAAIGTTLRKFASVTEEEIKDLRELVTPSVR